MSSHQVTHVAKDREGIITHIGAGTSWRMAKADAVRDIRSGARSFYVSWPEKRTDIHVVNATPAYLRTDRDSTTRNNLYDLPTF